MIANRSMGDFAQCSPLLGVTLRGAKRFQNDWEVAGADDVRSNYQFCAGVRVHL